MGEQLLPPGPDDPWVRKGRGDRCNNWHGYRGNWMVTDCMFDLAAAAAWIARGGLDESW